MSVVGVGFGNFVTRERVIAIVSPDSSPAKRAVQEARKDGTLVDATQGRKTKSVLYMDNGRVVVSGLGPETLAKRLDAASAEVCDAGLG